MGEKGGKIKKQKDKKDVWTRKKKRENGNLSGDITSTLVLVVT